MITLEEMFPPFGLRIECGPLELRYPRDEDTPILAELAHRGIQAPGSTMPFYFPWHMVPWEPGNPDAFPATSLDYWWASRARVRPESWRLLFLVRYDGEPVGMQDICTHADFRVTREAETGSWLTLDYQGQGIGTLMRQAIVGFCFDYLGAQSMVSGYIEGNAASAAVSRKVGYRDNGWRPLALDGERRIERLVRVTPDSYVCAPYPVIADGVGPLQRFLGIER